MLQYYFLKCLISVFLYNGTFNCLGSDHKTKDCRSITSHCKKFSKQYHTTLHRNILQQILHQELQALLFLTRQRTTSNTIGTRLALQPALQMTSQVILEAPSGKQTLQGHYWILDHQFSLITNQIVQQLQLEKNSTKPIHIRCSKI